MSQEREEGSLPRSRIFVELGELSSKQRGAVLGLIKDLGFETAEIEEVAIQIPSDLEGDPAGGKRGKRK